MSENATLPAGTSMNCEQVSQQEIAERYLLGQLSETDQEAYELHYFECARCFEELQTHQALQTELKRSAASIRTESLPQRIVWHWVWAPLAAMAILIVGLRVWQGLRHPSITAGSQVTVQQQEPSHSSVSSLTALGAIEPPRYVPVALRGNEDEATRKFQLAMQGYLKGNYAAAILGLRAALKLDPDATDARFYLGICYLLTDQTDRATAELRQTIALGDSPYLEGAHFFLAKAHLRKSEFAAAEDELIKVAGSHSSYRTEAAKLLDRIQTLRESQR